MPETTTELIRRSFEDIETTTTWCRKLQIKSSVEDLLIINTCNEVPVPLVNEINRWLPNITKTVGWKTNSHSIRIFRYRFLLPHFSGIKYQIHKLNVAG